MTRTTRTLTVAVALILGRGIVTPALAQTTPAASDAPYLSDRGPGLPTSMFGTYVEKGEWLIYPFFEYYRDQNMEYKPEELGATGDVDYRGRFRAREGLLFVAHGITDRLAFEVEAAVIRATFDKASADTSTLPSRIVESGLGDIEGQLRWRWRPETAKRPEVFSYFEITVPHHRSKVLIGTSDVELKTGTGVIRGFSWGTLTARAALEYAASSSSPFDIGEYSVEYLRRLSPHLRLYLGVEGSQDELSFLPELQWHVSRNAFVRFNNGVGFTSKATDWTPEVGIVISLRGRR
jgi:hypothetical protein